MVDSLIGLLVSWLVWLNRSVGWLVVYSWNSAVLRLEARCQLRKAVLRVKLLSKVKKQFCILSSVDVVIKVAL